MDLAGGSKPLPALVEYQVGGEAWRCNRFDLLAAEMDLAPNAEQWGEWLNLFHAVASSRERGWLIVRRLFGMQPSLPPSGTEPEDLRLWGREELRQALGMTRAQLKAELDGVRGAWKGIQNPKSEIRNPNEHKEKTEPKSEFDFAEEALLQRYGFEMRFTSVSERAWFSGRVKDYEKILNEKFAAMAARNALMSELRIHQLDEMLNDPDKPRGTEWKALLKLRQDVDGNYQRQIDQLQELCPWASAVAGKYAFVGVMSEVTKAIQAYEARGDTALIDGIFTATEIQIECRRSVQAPEPRYRAGVIVYLNAAKEGLWNANWQSQFEPRELKRLDAAWKAALLAAEQAEGIGAPDLEAEGEKGEYRELTNPQEPKI